MAANKDQFFIRKSSDYTFLRTKGSKKVFNGWLLLSFSKTDQETSRFGITIPNYVGKAIKRNRFKRWCKFYLRNQRKFLSENHCDVNIVFCRRPKEFYESFTYNQFEKVLSDAFRKTKLLSK